MAPAFWIAIDIAFPKGNCLIVAGVFYGVLAASLPGTADTKNEFHSKATYRARSSVRVGRGSRITEYIGLAISCFLAVDGGIEYTYMN